MDIKLLIGFDATSIINTVTITAVYIIQSSSTIPTAVIIESTEKTISKRITSVNDFKKVFFVGVFGALFK